jgi:hypothetical protein
MFAAVMEASLKVFWVWRRTVCYMDTNVLMKSDVSIFRVEVKSLSLPCKWRQYIPPKGYKLHGVTRHKIVALCHITSRWTVNISWIFAEGSVTERWKWLAAKGVGGKRGSVLIRIGR